MPGRKEAGLLHATRRRILFGGGSILAVAGCTSIGPTRLDRDQLDYGRVISEAGKRQTLFNIVRLRFGEPASFLAISQVVSGYTLQGTAGAVLNAYPSAAASTFWGLAGQAQYTDRPTFTLNPVTGEQFVEAYLRPFSPAAILPLIQGGIPVDGLLRLVAQSVGGIQNTHPLGGPSRSGSPDFLPLLAELRALQEGGALRVRILRDRQRSDRVFFLLHTPSSGPLRRSAERVYQMLSLDPAAREFEVIYGEGGDGHRSRAIPVLTRSLLTALYAVAAEIDLRDADIATRRAAPTLRGPTHPQPSIIIRSGPSEPDRSYTAVQIDGTWYWVDDTDFESKLSFTILEMLRSVAESSRGPSPPVLTIPAG
jgi:hypothetical protein